MHVPNRADNPWFECTNVPISSAQFLIFFQQPPLYCSNFAPKIFHFYAGSELLSIKFVDELKLFVICGKCKWFLAHLCHSTYLFDTLFHMGIRSSMTLLFKTYSFLPFSCPQISTAYIMTSQLSALAGGLSFKKAESYYFRWHLYVMEQDLKSVIKLNKGIY